MDDQDKSIVSTLWCAICRQYETRICGLKTFSRAWINGSSNHKMSNISSHTNSEPHKTAMMYLIRIRPIIEMSQSLATAPSLVVFFIIVNGSSCEGVNQEKVWYWLCSCKRTYSLLEVSSNPWMRREAWSEYWGSIQESWFCPKFYSLYCWEPKMAIAR